MKTAVFSARRYDKSMLAQANAGAGHELRFLEDRLSPATAVLAEGCAAVCVFVNDSVDAEVLALLVLAVCGGVTLDYMAQRKSAAAIAPVD